MFPTSTLHICLSTSRFSYFRVTPGRTQGVRIKIQIRTTSFWPTFKKIMFIIGDIVIVGQMDSNTSDYFVSHGSLSSVYFQGKEDGNMIDLGLSLKTLQPQAYHPSGHDYGELIDWQQLHPQLRSSNYEFTRTVTYDSAEDTDGVQSKSHCEYVKVNMDGVVVGRKVCLFDHSDYSSLAMQLEDMFGKHSVSGLHLFHAASEFCLFYKDRNEQWRTVGDVPWRKFIDRVKRLRIIQKNEAGMSSSASFS
ncbi:auxin-responsive protein IAA32-like isoform X2 [Apium graveolens]|uniref:auxin-responsive protein IAA32-like isoform X2 n=1 Tax=Apium graveolens TaxID=4045 RepID=UPI003D7AEF47